MFLEHSLQTSIVMMTMLTTSVMINITHPLKKIAKPLAFYYISKNAIKLDNSYHGTCIIIPQVVTYTVDAQKFCGHAFTHWIAQTNH